MKINHTMQNDGNALPPQAGKGLYRALSQKQCFHLMDHALRFKPPRHFDENLARPVLLKQLTANPEGKAQRFALKEWPVQWIRRDAYALIRHSITTVPANTVQGYSSSTLQGFGILVEWLNLQRYHTEYLEQYWLNSVLGFTEAMIRHPGGVSQLHQLHDVLEHHPMPWPNTLLDSSSSFSSNPGAFTHVDALYHTLTFSGVPPWAELCVLALHQGEHPLETGAINTQHEELNAALELAYIYLNCESYWPPSGIHQNSSLFWQWLLGAEARLSSRVSKTNLLGNQASVVLAEGLTEELLFYSIVQQFSPDQARLRVLSCGGKTVMPKRYQELRHWYRGTIKLVLDADGHDVQAIMEPQLRTHDALYRIPQGSMEDCYGLGLFIMAINTLRPGYPPLTEQDYQRWCEQNTVGRYNRSIIYQRFWQAQGLEQLDKSLLAKTVATLLAQQVAPLPRPLVQLAQFLVSSELPFPPSTK